MRPHLAFAVKTQAENASEEMEKRLKCALAGLEDEASELRAAQEEVARLRMSLEEAAVREEGCVSGFWVGFRVDVLGLGIQGRG